ncbi:hypothetical protein EDM56_21055 [Brevibacillus fluminis]|uniref:Uncharacterized protein n=1 Tax=Brevibacillus fluminis TaxID=511487 RepID=A0A3M8D9G5_9BACL|nr:hypothetical protein [Brevibacillus fluminis]RNB84598.1 hypothetical protein EDM56_21055 [Brevibacillus fluminis]
MKKSMFFVINWAEAKQYSDALKQMELDFTIETPDDIPSLAPGELAFVFPSLPIRLYAKLRTLFSQDAKKY